MDDCRVSVVHVASRTLFQVVSRRHPHFGINGDQLCVEPNSKVTPGTRITRGLYSTILSVARTMIDVCCISKTIVAILKGTVALIVFDEQPAEMDKDRQDVISTSTMEFPSKRLLHSLKAVLRFDFYMQENNKVAIVQDRVYNVADVSFDIAPACT